MNGERLNFQVEHYCGECGERIDTYLSNEMQGPVLNMDEEAYGDGLGVSIGVRPHLCAGTRVTISTRAAERRELLQTLEAVREWMLSDTEASLEHALDGHEEKGCILCRVEATITKAKGGAK